MIDIIDKKDCVGCAGCVQACPKQCISFDEDEQGFRYPKVDLSLCIHCNLCEKVCPVINQSAPQVPVHVYAARNTDEYVQLHSSSGGIFHALAEWVINQGGVVFGARFNDEWEVEHTYAETLEAAKAFQTSKYVQSQIGHSFRQAKRFLDDNRKVLFSGTPCQIAALRLFLRKDYGERLVAVDFICHGVPSPRVWREYLQSVTDTYSVSGQNSEFQSAPESDSLVITYINFRDKRLGWAKYGISVRAVAPKGDQNTEFQSVGISGEKELVFEPHYQNIFMKGFLKNLYLRPSCYHCPTRSGKSHADITLGDFWGVQSAYPQYYSEGYVSLLLVRNGLGEKILSSLDSVDFREVSLKKALESNPAIEKSALKPRQYGRFWQLFYKDGLKAIEPMVAEICPNFFKRCFDRSAMKILKLLTGIRRCLLHNS